MVEYLKFILLLNNWLLIWGSEPDELNTKVLTTKNFVFWPNATIPFYVNPDHFDQEQTIALMTGLATFAFKTCVKFAPVMDNPKEDQHVMVFVNPEGMKRCKFETSGHSIYEPHRVVLGYECLQSPQLDMMIMKALGFPFEHNRLSRDLYIDVLLENIEPGAVELFTKDIGLPVELRAQPYDINSVMHFGQRDYSKNGHRTILFKNPTIQQNRIGLSATDLKKINLVYGPECQKRDRMEKIELCQSYPGAARKKREVEQPTSAINLRVNRNITPPPGLIEDTSRQDAMFSAIANLGIETEAQEVVDQVYKVSAKVLKLAKEKYCNNTERLPKFNSTREAKSDILGILSLIVEYSENTLDLALQNLTVFCQDPDSIDVIRKKCGWKTESRCVQSYKSTKSGKVIYSTKRWPHIVQSTKHRGQAATHSYDNVAWRSNNETSEATPLIKIRRKREARTFKKASSKDKLHKEKIIKERFKVKDSSVETKTSASVAKRRYFEKRRFQARTYGGAKTHWSQSQSREAPEMESQDLETENQQYESPNTETQPPVRGKEQEIKREDEEEEVKLKPEESEEEEEITTTTATPAKQFKQKKSKEKQKLKDTFELMEEKKRLKEERLEKKPKMKKRTRNVVPTTVHMTKLNREFYNERRWPEGIIRYVITPLKGYDIENMRSRLDEVAHILHKKTCVKFEEVTQEQADNYEDYLVLDNSPDFITGRVGGRQHFGCLELFEGGQHKQHAAMMVMAMLGFYFEVARHDRDRYIRVHMRHIRPDKLHHFEKIRDEATLNLSYDYKSATHPAWQFWRKIGKTGISTVATYKGTDPDGSIMRTLGQHEQILSDYDIIKINTIYGIECFTDTQEMRAV